MKQLEGQQLSLIAEDEYEDRRPGDWDEPSAPLRERSIEDIRKHFINLANGGQPKPDPDLLVNKSSEFWDSVPDLPIGGSLFDLPDNGGQPQTPITPMGGNGGQLKNSPNSQICPPKERLFDRQVGDEGTWTETEHRKSGDYQYLRWRDGKSKRSRYLGKLRYE